MAIPPPPPRTAHHTHRTVRRIAVLVTTVSMAMVGALALGAPAQAKTSAAELKKQITDTNNQIEQYAEKVNGAKAKLKADQNASAKLAAQIGPLQLQADVAGKQLTGIAVQLYKTGGPTHTLQALLDSSSTQTLLDELGALNEMARGQKAAIDGASKLVGQYTTKKKQQDALAVRDRALVASLADSKKKAESHLSHLQTLYAEANVSTGGNGGGGGSSGGGGGGSSGGSGSSKFTKSYVKPVACPQSSAGGKGHTAAVKACSLLYPIHMYRINNAGPTYYDCSGLTMTAWKAAGVSLDHWTGSKSGGQWAQSTHIAKSDLEPGDLVFYNSGNHVALYVGNNWIVQAEETGQPVKMSKVTFESIVDTRRVKQ